MKITWFSSVNCEIPIALIYFSRVQCGSGAHQWNFPFEPYPITARKSNLNKDEINLQLKELKFSKMETTYETTIRFGYPIVPLTKYLG